MGLRILCVMDLPGLTGSRLAGGPDVFVTVQFRADSLARDPLGTEEGLSTAGGPRRGAS